MLSQILLTVIGWATSERTNEERTVTTGGLFTFLFVYVGDWFLYLILSLPSRSEITFCMCCRWIETQFVVMGEVSLAINLCRQKPWPFPVVTNIKTKTQWAKNTCTAWRIPSHVSCLIKLCGTWKKKTSGLKLSYFSLFLISIGRKTY